MVVGGGIWGRVVGEGGRGREDGRGKDMGEGGRGGGIWGEW